MDNILTIKERILFIAKQKGYSLEKFCEKIGMTYANFKGQAKKRPINSNTIAKIITIIPETNLYWLVLGKGLPFTSPQEQDVIPKKSGSSELSNYLDKQLKIKEKEIQECYKLIGRLEGELMYYKKERPTG